MNKNDKKILKLLINKKPTNRKDFFYHLKKISGQFHQAPSTNIELLKAYHNLVKSKTLKLNPQIDKFLTKRAVRTLSGVAVIAVLTKPFPCPGKCAFCPSQKKMPKSYLSNEPAVMRAILCKFDPYKQVAMRLAALKMTGHSTDKCELIVMGGTWSVLPPKYQHWFIKRCFDAFNTKVAKNLTKAQKTNETAKNRVIGLTLETRPDYITPEEIKRMRNLGCTKVELGVQAIDNKILDLNCRGHKVDTIINATKLLKDSGFKVLYHMMPNLPGSSVAKDFLMFKKLFNNSNFQPDMLKIYPCVVTRDSKLYHWNKQGKFKVYSDNSLLNLLIKIKKIIPPYVRIVRLIRDIPGESIIAGNKISNLREFIAKKLKDQNTSCQCIRCCEPKEKDLVIKSAKLVVRKYSANDGQEYFLSYESVANNKRTLYAFLRLRLPKLVNTKLIQQIPDIKDSALIREIHTYGKLIPLKSKTKAIQHAGFGKLLIKKAEEIARKNGYKKMTVISGIGVRQYYHKLGYQLGQNYMIKNI